MDAAQSRLNHACLSVLDDADYSRALLEDDLSTLQLLCETLEIEHKNDVGGLFYDRFPVHLAALNVVFRDMSSNLSNLSSSMTAAFQAQE